MRLWHYKLISVLPRLQLLGQHRECCALRGKGWQKKHQTVDYVFKHNYIFLYHYHCLILKEMQKRNYQPAKKWFNPFYRGKNCPPQKLILYNYQNFALPYPEHNDDYLRECLDNLKGKMNKNKSLYSANERERLHSLDQKISATKPPQQN